MLFLSVMSTFAQTDKPNWDGWKIVMGDWTGSGTGDPGKGSGGFSFKLDLQGQVLVRKAHSEYPSAGGRVAVHDDLMIVYQEPGRTRATYFDNEGHVIHYTASFSPDGRTLVLVSDPLPNAPSFRLTYVSVKPDELKVDFEIAPPGSNAFKSYVSGVVHRTK